jgi:excisionase family DNA binding protein
MEVKALVSNVRLAIVCVAGLLVILSIVPLRRRLPLVRLLPRGTELVVWIGFVGLCLNAFAGVRTVQSTRLSLAAAHAAIDITGQAAGSVLGPAAHWVSVREPAVAVVTLGLAAVAWILVALRALAMTRRAIRPKPRLGGGWVIVNRRRGADRPRVQSEPAVAPAPLMDVHSAATYLGVSHATVYRWARAGRLSSRRAGTRLHFSRGDVAAMHKALPPPSEERDG